MSRVWFVPLNSLGHGRPMPPIFFKICKLFKGLKFSTNPKEHLVGIATKYRV